jgi:hypothetical protein
MAPITLTDKLRLEWPVLITILGCVWYLGTTLSTINERLVAIETRIQIIERSLPGLQVQVAAQGERISRLEATGSR